MQNLKESRAEIGRMVEQVKIRAISKNYTISTAESCTGGKLAESLTHIPGSSNFFDSSIITYSNSSKIKLLGVLPETIKNYGAVSENVVREMSLGLLVKTQSDVGIAISGIMGPDADGTGKDIGTVWFSIRSRDRHLAKMHKFEGDRDSNRKLSVLHALNYLSDFIDEV